MTTDSTQPEASLSLPPFKNERIFPGIDDPTVRDAFPQALAKVRTQLGRTYPLYIDGQDVTTDSLLDSVNPADPEQIVGKVCQAGVAGMAARAFPPRLGRDLPGALGTHRGR